METTDRKGEREAEMMVDDDDPISSPSVDNRDFGVCSWLVAGHQQALDRTQQHSTA